MARTFKDRSDVRPVGRYPVVLGDGVVTYRFGAEAWTVAAKRDAKKAARRAVRRQGRQAVRHAL